ncbi:hypothetical protein CALCODRAFT_519701 [Calocera cornea HHB12733]|uniref:Uncharacterized protein n=1 Tax=Calocera cornea HHB12733 TaxID=1353952 RepID=A0A165E2Y0_9BASI|nr:hypothetical protein CALCODRAFT_519701 [Calocera cornea HHB12733]
MFCNGFEVWLEVEGKRMLEHKPSVPEQSKPGQFKTTCYVLSEPGKTFRIWGKHHLEQSASKGPKRQVLTVMINLNEVCKIYSEDSERQTAWRWATGAEIMSSKAPGGTPGFVFENAPPSPSRNPSSGKITERSIAVTIRPEVGRRVYEDEATTQADDCETGKDEYGRAYREVWKQDGDERCFTFHPASFFDLQLGGVLPSTHVVYLENYALKEQNAVCQKQGERLVEHNQALEDSLKRTNKLMETLLEDKETLLKERTALVAERDALVAEARRILAEIAKLRTSEGDSAQQSEDAAAADPRKRRRS